jgi:hypothetical protein
MIDFLVGNIHLQIYSDIHIIPKLSQDDNKKLAVSFNHTLKYIDDVLSINNHNFHNYVHLIYPDEFEIKDTIESDKICFIYSHFTFILTPVTD